MHKMILVIKRNIYKVSGFPDIVLKDIYYMHVDAKGLFSGYQSKSEILTFTSPLKWKLCGNECRGKLINLFKIKLHLIKTILLKEL